MSGSAAERVAASRTAITRQWIADATAARGDGGERPAQGLWGECAEWALDLAGARKGRPAWRAATQLACSLAEETVSPLARRHPWALVGSAALGGALLVTARPWRWKVAQPTLARLFTQVALAAMAQAAARRAEERGGPR